MKYKVTALVLLVFLTGTSLLSFLLPDHYFSLREKRKLQQLPQFRMEAVLDKRYIPALEDYLTDQFPGRDGWISLKTLSELVMGRRERSGVYLGRDGYLIDSFRQMDPAVLEHNIRHLGKLTEEMESMGLPVSVILVPTAAEILKEKLPPGAVSVDQKELTQSIRDSGIPLLDVIPILEAHREEPLYYRTDHHYTSLGAWYCFDCWQQARGRPAGDREAWTREVLTDQFRGTTWSRVGTPWTRPDTITAWYQHRHAVTYNHTRHAESLYEMKYLEKDPYAVFLDSNQALSVIEGSGSTGRLLLIKDSFGNTFSQFPAEEFEQVHVIDLRFFAEDLQTYLQEQEITEVLILYGLQNFAVQTKIQLP